MTRRVIYADEVQLGDTIRSGFDWGGTDAITGLPAPFLKVVRIRDPGPYVERGMDGEPVGTNHILSFIVEDIEGNQYEHSFNILTPVELGTREGE